MEFWESPCVPTFLRVHHDPRSLGIQFATTLQSSPCHTWHHVFCFFSPTAGSFGVSAQIGSGVVRGGPEVRFHEGSTSVPPVFHQGSTRVPQGFHEDLRGLRGGASTKKSTACCWGCHLSLFCFSGCLLFCGFQGNPIENHHVEGPRKEEEPPA